MDFIKTVDALKEILKKMKNQMPLSDEKRADIAISLAQFLHDNKIDLKDFLIADPNNKKILAHALVFMAAYDKDTAVPSNMKTGFLTLLFMPALKMKPVPEFKFNKEELVALLLTKLKKDPNFKPHAERISKEINENNELDAALSDLTNINILGYDPKGIRTTVAATGGKTNTSGLVLLSHHSDFRAVLESALFENPVFFEQEDERYKIAGEEQSLSERKEMSVESQQKKDYFEKKNAVTAEEPPRESPFDAALRRVKSIKQDD